MMRVYLMLSALALMISCSSGSDPSGDIIDRSGRSVGQISAFGSVIVNGVTFETSNSIITVDDQAGQESDLAVGQIVVIDGLINPDGNTGIAERITLDPYLRGPVSALDANASILTVLGARVSVVSATLFGESILPADLGSLMVGDTVEVYGYLSSTGTLVATRIQRSADTDLEVRGRVSNLDANARSFELNSLIVNFETAVLEGFSNAIANGDLVEAEGDTLVGNVLNADRVELESTGQFSSADENTEVELEGIITVFVDVTNFQIDSIQISTDAATEFEGGSQADLGLDVGIEVEGRINADGVLVADEIDFELNNNLEIEAPVESVDPLSQSVTLLGLELGVSPQTQLIDESDVQLRFFSLSDVVAGDFLKIKAFTDGMSATLTLLKRKNPEDALKLEGAVTSLSNPSLFVGAIQVDTTSATTFEIADSPVTIDEFFAALMVGDEVSVQGQSPATGVLLAESLSIE